MDVFLPIAQVFINPIEILLLSACTKDLQPNPYTTIIKHIIKGDKK